MSNHLAIFIFIALNTTEVSKQLHIIEQWKLTESIMQTSEIMQIQIMLIAAAKQSCH